MPVAVVMSFVCHALIQFALASLAKMMGRAHRVQWISSMTINHESRVLPVRVSGRGCAHAAGVGSPGLPCLRPRMQSGSNFWVSAGPSHFAPGCSSSFAPVGHADHSGHISAVSRCCSARIDHRVGVVGALGAPRCDAVPRVQPSQACSEVGGEVVLRRQVA